MRNGEGINKKFDIALNFVRAILSQKGSVAGYQLNAVLDAGFTEEEVAEIIGYVSLTMLTNYFNNIVNTEFDLPKIALPKKL